MAIDISNEGTRAAQRHIETYLRSLFAIHNLPAPGGDQLGQLVHAGMGLLGPEARRSPDRIGPAMIGQLDGLVLASVEAGRVRNLYGAEAARAAQAGIGPDGQRGGAGFGYIDAVRAGSNARYRDLPASESNQRSVDADAAAASGYASAASLNYVSAASFARTPFAAAGMNYGTLVQRWLGHARLTTTAIYAEVSGPEEQTFAEGFQRWSEARAA